MGVVEEEEVGQGEEALVEVSWGEEGEGGQLCILMLDVCHIIFIVRAEIDIAFDFQISC